MSVLAASCGSNMEDIAFIYWIQVPCYCRLYLDSLKEFPYFSHPYRLCELMYHLIYYYPISRKVWMPSNNTDTWSWSFLISELQCHQRELSYNFILFPIIVSYGMRKSSIHAKELDLLPHKNLLCQRYIKHYIKQRYIKHGLCHVKSPHLHCKLVCVRKYVQPKKSSQIRLGPGARLLLTNFHQII